jgi:hypothetical protein
MRNTGYYEKSRTPSRAVMMKDQETVSLGILTIKCVDWQYEIEKCYDLPINNIEPRYL